MSENEKCVLICTGERKRPVTFTGSKEQLLTAIKDAFSDVVKPESNIFLQIKDEAWGGMFVDLRDEDNPDRSILKAVVSESTPTGQSLDQVVRLHAYRY